MKREKDANLEGTRGVQRKEEQECERVGRLEQNKANLLLWLKFKNDKLTHEHTDSGQPLWVQSCFSSHA